MRPCEVKGRKATFHKWEHKAWVLEPSPMVGGYPGGQMAMDLAIIEYEDGVVTECYPYEVKFTDKEATNGHQD